MNKFLMQQQAGQLHGAAGTEDVTVSGAYPTLLPPTPQAGRKDFIVYNGTGEILWIGGSAVTRFDGLPVANGASLSIQGGRVGIYGIIAGTTASGVRVLEIS